MPASERQIAANRRNAAGPHQMTEPGKEAIRANAIRHGLTSRLHVVLAGEDAAFFHELLDSLLADYAPDGTQETLLVHQIAEHFWRLLRARGMETASLSGSLQDFLNQFELPAQPVPEPGQLALSYAQHYNLFGKLSRYETTIERSYYRAIRELQKLQSSRIRSVSQNRESITEPNDSEIQQPHEPCTKPPEPIRSVSQIPKPAPPTDIEALQLACITMSEEGIDKFLDELTAPPKRSSASADSTRK